MKSRLHSICVHVLPVLLVCFVVVRGIAERYALVGEAGVDAVLWDARARGAGNGNDLFDERLSLPVQLLLTGCLGAFLMSAFSFVHSAFAILCAGLYSTTTYSEITMEGRRRREASSLAYFPPLYTVRVWEVTSVRMFWSYGWHRLFARFFLVYGVWPGEWLERIIRSKLLGQVNVHQAPADIGKVLGGFLSSAFCHSFAVRGVLGGDWYLARGEAVFFALNGVAVIVEEGVKKAVLAQRRRKLREHVRWKGSEEQGLVRWYDGYVGRAWWICVLLYMGRNFARGWVNAGLVREMAAL